MKITKYPLLKFFVGLLGILFITSSLIAQEQEEVVYLENGSIIRGKVLETTDEKIKIRIIGGSVLVFPADQVIRIDQENVLTTNTINIKEPRYNKQRGLLLETKIGALMNGPEGDTPGTSVGLFAGYQFVPFFAIGAGIDWVNYADAGFLPLYGGIRIRPVRKIPVVLGINSGYAFPVRGFEGGDTREGGWHFNPELTVLIPARKHHYWTVGAGFHTDKISRQFESPWSGGTTTHIRRYDRMSIKVGLSF